MRRYLAVYAGAVAACLIAVASVNCLVDVNGIYHAAERKSFAAAYVASLRASTDGLVFSTYERSVKLALLHATDADCYIAGSSHEMQFALDNFTPAATQCHSLVNLAVSGASFEDLLTDVGVLEEHSGLRTLFVGIGPWMLRRGADGRWTEVRDAFLLACARLHITSCTRQVTVFSRLGLLYNALNGQYLWRNLQALMDRRPPIIAADERQSADAVMEPDGSFRYSEQFLAATPSRAQAVGEGQYKIAEPYVDASVVADLAAALKVLVNRGVHVVLVLTPYHPKVMRCHSANVCAAMTAVDCAVRTMARSVGADVIGSFDPAAFALGWRDFYDDMHVSREALRRMRWPSVAQACGTAASRASSPAAVTH